MQKKIEFLNYSLWLGKDAVLKAITLDVPRNAVLSVFGPAGGGKSGLLRSINRMAELTPGEKHEGDIRMDGGSIFAAEVDVPDLRRKAGMVFAQPVPLPMSIWDNVTYGLRLQKTREKGELDAAVQRALMQATLWDEVKDRLDSSGLALSGGQQQRLSIARVLALQPEVLLLDAPTAALDPISTAKIEEMLLELKQNYTIVIVPHSVQQAARVSDYAAFFMGGEMIESGPRDQIFVKPHDQRTENYVSGRFG
ncbi:MAG: phosphate ABC transporter ATP-binding protein [Anaerolineae bacterium]|nr:phosphate ABC transporter ATP-binding protein [Anaerolineae bacterium]